MKTNCTTCAALLFLVCILTHTTLKGQTITTGLYHTLAICTDSTVKSWGDNTTGKLGDGTTVSRLIPGGVNILTRVRDVAAGANGHSLALKADGTLWVWGNGGDGALGDGTTTNHLYPIQLSGFTDVKAIAAGYNHTLALKADGTVWAWGYNSNGQLGDGTTTSTLSPVQVIGLTGVVEIAAKGAYSLALKEDGTVWAWGQNTAGQLGDGTTTKRLTPVQAAGLTVIKAIAVGNSFSMALKEDGTVWTWGNNQYGQLGNGTTSGQFTPGKVNGVTGIRSIATGYDHALALNRDGTVWSWGANGNGQLGIGSITKQTTPVQVGSLTGVISIAGADNSLAIKTDGTVWGWGRNDVGQLGDGTTVNKLIPVQITGLCPALPPSSKVNTVKGYCFIDTNTNNVKDAGEPGIPNLLVSSIGSLYTFSSSTTQQGMFNNIADLKTITTTPPAVRYHTFSPAQYVSNFTSFDNKDSINFAFVPIPNVQDLRLTIIPLNGARAGRDVNYRMVYENIGTKTISDTVFMTMNSGLTFVSANPAPGSVNGNVLEWTYSNLIPFESRSIDVTLEVPISATIGTILLPSARIEPIPTDTIPNDNYSNIEQSVIASFDPNDKTMLQGDNITTQQVANGDYMDYLIRFQNTGNDSAFVVVVRDTLDSKLDWNTFQMISTSHTCTTGIRNGKNITWTFDNILLPDSNVDEPGSHGYICYRIKPKNNLVLGNVIKNAAHIYFDYNAPVPTNTVNTTIASSISVEEIPLLGVQVFPNPNNGSMRFIFASPLTESTVLSIYNLMGEKVKTVSIEKGTDSFNINDFLSEGLYLYLFHSKSFNSSGKFAVLR